MNIDKQYLEQEGLDVKTLNKIIKRFQKAGAKYNGIQCAIAMEMLLRALCPETDQRTLVEGIVDNFFDIEVGN